jgi:hypothetical protein
MNKPSATSKATRINHLAWRIPPTILALALATACSADETDTAPAPAEPPIDITLVGGVLNALDNGPIAGASLLAVDASGAELATTTSDDAGSYQMTFTTMGEGFLGNLAVTVPGYWTRRFFAVSEAIPSGQDITFHMQSDELIALQEQLLQIDIDEARGLVGVTLQGQGGMFVDADFPAEIDIDAPYELRIYLNEQGRPDAEKQSGWFAIFLNVAPGPVAATAVRTDDGSVYGQADLTAIARELTGAWIYPD